MTNGRQVKNATAELFFMGNIARKANGVRVVSEGRKIIGKYDIYLLF